MKVDYDHSRNPHASDGPMVAVPYLLRRHKPKSVLDIGCGTGTWLNAFSNHGVQDFLGIDGIDLAKTEIHISKDKIHQHNLTQPLHLERTFDLAISFEVAEHLPYDCSSQFIRTITEHADVVFFSAAIPGQKGQHHVNCQWPAFWQKHFNECGFVCSDDIRFEIWNDEAIDPWYRQNIFEARRSPGVAGTEPRIKPVIHPNILPSFLEHHRTEVIEEITNGSMSHLWYPRASIRAFLKKIGRKVVRSS